MPNNKFLSPGLASLVEDENKFMSPGLMPTDTESEFLSPSLIEPVPNIDARVEEIRKGLLKGAEPKTKPKSDFSVSTDNIQGQMINTYLRPSGKEVTWTDEPLLEGAKKALVDIAKQQGINLVGTGELAMNIASGMMLFLPSKLYGVMALPFGREVADIAEEEIAKFGYQPYTKDAKEASALVGKGFELYLKGAKNADEFISQYSPRAGYLVGFGYELAMFAFTGATVKGVKSRLKVNIEQANKIIEAKRKLEIDTIEEKVKAVDQMPNEVMRDAQKKVLEMEKIQAELEAKEMAAGLDYGEMIKEDLSRRGKKIKDTKSASVKAFITNREKTQLKSKGYTGEQISKMRPEEAAEILKASKVGKEVKQPKKRIVDEQVDKAMEKIKIEEEIGPIPIEDVAKEFNVRYDNEMEGVGYQWTDLETKSTFYTKKQDMLEMTEKLKEVRRKFKEAEESETVKSFTDLDLQTGTREPIEFSTDKHPLRQTPEHTQQMKTVYEESIRGVESDIELFTGKKINDVNLFLDGEKIDIGKTRDQLSELASRADELRYDFTGSEGFPSNFENWKELVSDAAEWARKAERKKVDGDVQLNMMIPLDKIPRLAKDIINRLKSLHDIVKEMPGMKDRYIKFADLYRNKEIFDKTGFWLGKDGKWRYEIDSSKAKNHPPQSVRTLHTAGRTSQAMLTDVLGYPELYKAVPELNKLKVIYDPKLRSDGSYSSQLNAIFLKHFGDKLSLMHEVQHAVNEKTGSKFLGTNVGVQIYITKARLALNRIKEVYNDIKSEEVKEYAKESMKELRDQIATNNLSLDWPSWVSGEFTRYLEITGEKKAADIAKFPLFFGETVRDISHKRYMKDPGEMEARLASERMDMSAKEREAKPPWETLDEMLVGEGIAVREGGMIDVTAGTKLYSGIPADKAVELLKDTVKYIRGKLIKSVSSSEPNLLKDITSLYTDKKIDADITYSKGAMWKGTDIDPKYKFDQRIEAEGVTKADITKNIPLEDSSVGSVMFDPPFLVHSTGKKTGIMGKRFTAAKSIDELWKMHRESIGEAFRILEPGGKLIVKIKDLSRHRALIASSAEVYNSAISKGFKPIDRFIYTGKRQLPLPPNVKVQATSRKVHVDYWVFEKPKKHYTYPSEGGVKLYSGIPVDRIKSLFKRTPEGTPKIDLTKLSSEELVIYKAGSEWNKAFEDARKAKRFNLGQFLDRANLHTYRAIHEQKGKLRTDIIKKYGKDGYKVIQYMDAESGYSGHSQRMTYEMRKEALKGVPGKMTASVDATNLMARLKDIYQYKTPKQFKPPKNMSPKQTAAFDGLLELYRGLSKEERIMAEKASQTMFDHVKRWVDEMVEVGLKSPEEGELLKAHNYRKIRSINVENLYDQKYNVRVGDKLVRQTDSGVDSLGKNAITMMETDTRVLYNETAKRIFRRIDNQRTKLAWKEFDAKHPENPYIIIKKNDKTLNRSDRSIPKGWVKDYWYDNGVRETMYFHPDIALQLMSSGSHMSYPLTRFLTNALGVNLTRSLAVGTSGMWAITRGLTMDIGHTFFSARQLDPATGKWSRIYSRIGPKYIPQIGRDMGGVFYDVFTRGYKTGMYEKHGGMMPFLAMREQSIMGRGIKPPGYWSQFIDGMSYVAKSMEMLNRVAVMDRKVRLLAKEKGITSEQAYKNKDLVEEAVNVAVERLPYSQGGWLVKSIDSVFGPFISASYNAVRTFTRGAKENPVDFWARIGNIAIPTVAGTIAATLFAPEVVRDTPEYDHARSATFPFFPDSLNFIDEEGNIRYINVQIPLDPMIATVYNIFRGLTNKMLYEAGYTEIEPDYQAIVDSITSTFPMDAPASPAIQAWYAYFRNIDTWKNRKIVPESERFDMPDSQVEGQRDPRVSQLAKDIGKVTKVSPKRLSAAARNFGLPSNEWTWALGKLYDEAFNDMDPRLRKQHWAITLSKTPGIKNLMGVTVPRAYRMGDRRDLEKVDQLESFLRRDELDFHAEGYYWKGVGSEFEIDKFIDGFEEEHIVKGLEKRRKFTEDIKDLPHRSSWKNYFHTSPEAKAKDFYKIWLATPENEKSALDSELDDLLDAGYVSEVSQDRFFDVYDRLRSEPDR